MVDKTSWWLKAFILTCYEHIRVTSKESSNDYISSSFEPCFWGVYFLIFCCFRWFSSQASNRDDSFFTACFSRYFFTTESRLQDNDAIVTVHVVYAIKRCLWQDLATSIISVQGQGSNRAQWQVHLRHGPLFSGPFLERKSNCSFLILVSSLEAQSDCFPPVISSFRSFSGSREKIFCVTKLRLVSMNGVNYSLPPFFPLSEQ